MIFIFKSWLWLVTVIANVAATAVQVVVDSCCSFLFLSFQTWIFYFFKLKLQWNEVEATTHPLSWYLIHLFMYTFNRWYISIAKLKGSIKIKKHSAINCTAAIVYVIINYCADRPTLQELILVPFDKLFIWSFCLTFN